MGVHGIYTRKLRLDSRQDPKDSRQDPNPCAFLKDTFLSLDPQERHRCERKVLWIYDFSEGDESKFLLFFVGGACWKVCITCSNNLGCPPAQ